MLGNRRAIDLCAIGAVEILKRDPIAIPKDLSVGSGCFGIIEMDFASRVTTDPLQPEPQWKGRTGIRASDDDERCHRCELQRVLALRALNVAYQVSTSGPSWQ